MSFHFTLSSPVAAPLGKACTAKRTRLMKAMAFGLAVTGMGFTAQAADITMTASDTAGQSSLYSNLRWSDGAVPTAGNNYFTGAFVLRTPAATVSGDLGAFGGNSLSIDTGGRFLGKIGNNVGGNSIAATITVNNLILNGGTFDQAGSAADTSTLNVAGNVIVNASSTLGALGSTAANSANFETLNFLASISGSGALTVAGTANGNANTGVVRFSAENTYSGNITVAAPSVIASQVNRLLQLNHLNALQNATLTINANSGVSFASAVNMGAFKIGALAGASNQTLTDTAGAPVMLNIGGNNASTTYGGAFSGGGSLLKTGTGTFTTTGNSSFTGGVNINGGTLQLGAGAASGNAGQSGGTITFSADNTRLLLNRTGVNWNYNIALGSGTGTNTVAAATGVPTSWAGGINGGGGQTLQFNDASNAGTITLTSSTTYVNPTTLFAGTLIVNGSILNSTVTVNDTATLAGGTSLTPGTIGAVSVKASGTLAPGPVGTFSTGGLNIGAVDLEAASIFALDINSTVLATDFIAVSGSLSLAITNNAVLSITDLAPTAIDSGNFTFITYPTATWNGGLFNVGGNMISDYDATFNPNSTTFGISGNTYRLDYDAGGNSVVLMAVPEPGSLASLVVGLGCLLGVRRRRK